MYQINKTQGGFDMESKKKVPTLNKVAYGIGTGGGCIFNQIAAAFLLNYYTDTVLIGAGAIATMFLVCRIFDGVTDLVMGGIVDKTSSRLGKARPWLIASAPLTLLGIVLLMNVPAGLGETGKLAYAYITYIFMNCIVYTIYGISNTALLPLMTHDKNESTMLATFSALGNNIIGLLAGSLITPLVLNFGWKTSSVILGGAGNGEVYDFDAVNSTRARLGARLSKENGERGTYYAGLAYEYEFDGEAKATVKGLSTPAPSIKGSSGMLELGYIIQNKDVNAPAVDIGFQGWSGKKQGFSGNINFIWKF